MRAVGTLNGLSSSVGFSRVLLSREQVRRVLAFDKSVSLFLGSLYQSHSRNFWLLDQPVTLPSVRFCDPLVATGPLMTMKRYRHKAAAVH